MSIGANPSYAPSYEDRMSARGIAFDRYREHMKRRRWNNPEAGEIFYSLADLFAPGAGERAGLDQSAKARAAREDAERKAFVFEQSQDPGTSWETLDRLGFGAGLQTGTQTLQSVDRNNARALDERRMMEAGMSSRNAADNARALEDRRLQEQGSLSRAMLDPVAAGATRFVPPTLADMYSVPEQQVGALSASQGEMIVAPDGRTVIGAPKPLSDTEWRAQQGERLRSDGQLTDQMILDTIMGSETPVQAIGANGTPTFMSPGAAVRTGAAPYNKPDADRVDNYLAVGPNGDEVRFVGYVGPDGRIFNVDTRQPVPNVVRKESTGGGVSFETDGQGGIKLSTGNAAGNTTARTTDLQRQEAEAGRAVNELTALFDTLRPDDLGAAGNINDLLTNYAAQAFPGVARPDVAATRAQLKATTLGLARSLIQDDRLSDSDRRAANEVMVSDGLGESLPGAQAKIAALVALSAYRKKYANAVRTGGEKLPPLDGPMLGRLVDEGAISPRVADVYARTVLRAPPGPSGGASAGPRPPAAITPPTPPAPAGGPVPGTIEDGYRFRGGDPSDPANWAPVR